MKDIKTLRRLAEKHVELAAAALDRLSFQRHAITATRLERFADLYESQPKTSASTRRIKDRQPA